MRPATQTHFRERSQPQSLQVRLQSLPAPPHMLPCLPVPRPQAPLWWFVPQQLKYLARRQSPRIRRLPPRPPQCDFRQPRKTVPRPILRTRQDPRRKKLATAVRQNRWSLTRCDPRHTPAAWRALLVSCRMPTALPIMAPADRQQVDYTERTDVLFLRRH